MTHPETNPRVDDLLKQGVEAARANDRPAARALLEEVVQLDERNEKAWFWLAAVVDTAEEKRVCLGNVIVINPENDRAKRLLAQLEEQETAPAATPPPAPEDAPRRRSVNLALVLGALAVVALVIVLIALLGGGDDDEPSTVENGRPNVSIAERTDEPSDSAAPAAQTGGTPTPAITTTPPEATRTPIPTWTPSPSPSPVNTGPATALPLPPVGMSGQIAMRSGLVLGDERLQPIMIVEPDSGDPRIVSESGERGTAPALAPGARYVAYIAVTSTREQILKVVRLDQPEAPWFWGGTPRLDRQDMPSWSPDGAWIALTAYSFSDQLPDLYRVTGFAADQQEETLERLTQDNAIESWPAFSPDSTQIVYAVDMSPSGGATEIRILDIATGQFRNLTGNGDELIESSPDWSPDGTQIVFHAYGEDAANSDIYLVPADGSAAPEKIVDSDASDIHPRFSPDSRSIVFSSNRTGNWDVFIYEIASGETYQLTSSTTVEIATDWTQ